MGFPNGSKLIICTGKVSEYLLLIVLTYSSQTFPKSNFGDGTSCFSLKGENDWWDRGPVIVFSYSSQTAVLQIQCTSEMALRAFRRRGGTIGVCTCNRIFVKSNTPVNPMHFGDGTSGFSLKGENDWWDITRRRTGQTRKTVG